MLLQPIRSVNYNNKINRVNMNRINFRSKTLLPDFVKEFGEGLYRGRRPDLKELDQLSKMGITTIVDFSTKDPSCFNEAEYAAKYGMKYFALPFDMSDVTNSIPAQQFFDIIYNVKQAKGKLYAHCLLGIDRTGLMVNLYKIRSGLPLNDSNWMQQSLAESLYILHGLNK